MQGRHEYDGQLPDWSRAGIEKEIARVDQDLFWMEKAGIPFRNPEFYFGWMGDSLDPSAYIALDYASLEQRMRSFGPSANDG